MFQWLWGGAGLIIIFQSIFTHSIKIKLLSFDLRKTWHFIASRTQCFHFFPAYIPPRLSLVFVCVCNLLLPSLIPQYFEQYWVGGGEYSHFCSLFPQLVCSTFSVASQESLLLTEQNLVCPQEEMTTTVKEETCQIRRQEQAQQLRRTPWVKKRNLFKNEISSSKFLCLGCLVRPGA